MDILKRALQNPPDKPDFGSACLSVASALLVGYKILNGGKSLPGSFFELFVLIAVTVAAYVAVRKGLRARKPNELTEGALQFVNDLIAVQKVKPEVIPSVGGRSAGTSLPPGSFALTPRRTGA